jgi:hypothetical protein
VVAHLTPLKEIFVRGKLYGLDAGLCCGTEQKKKKARDSLLSSAFIFTNWRAPNNQGKKKNAHERLFTYNIREKTPEAKDDNVSLKNKEKGKSLGRLWNVFLFITLFSLKRFDLFSPSFFFPRLFLFFTLDREQQRQLLSDRPLNSAQVKTKSTHKTCLHWMNCAPTCPLIHCHQPGREIHPYHTLLFAIIDSIRRNKRFYPKILPSLVS